jgi:hypothetical protein
VIVADRIYSQSGTLYGVRVDCPGCRRSHIVTVPPWTWNESVERPTFSPSLLCYENKREDGSIFSPRCHSFIRDGQIQFLSDCGHALAGQTVPLPPIDPDKILVGDEPTEESTP